MSLIIYGLRDVHCTSDRSVVIFQKTAVAVVALLAAFLKTVVAIVMWLC